MNEPIRVLHVVTYMGRGGLETMLMNYYRHIDRNKVQFDFLVHRKFEADYDSEILSLGGNIYRLPRLNPFSMNYRKQLDLFFKQHKEYKIVHVHQDCLSSIILKYAKKNNVPIRIAHSHNANQDKNLRYLIKLFYRQFIPKYATDLFACSREAGNWMFKGKKYQILTNAIPARKYIFSLNKRNIIREELNIQDEFVVGLVARFSFQKNHDFLLDIFCELIKSNPNSILMLIGDGNLRPQIEEKINKLHLQDKVILTGIRTDISDLLQVMDVFVMPSLYEGLPLSIIEAQASGLPCFISNKVPIECKKTNLVNQISLSESPKYWAKQILKAKDIEHRNTYTEIVESGFDIEENAKQLQELYIGKVGD